MRTSLLVVALLGLGACATPRVPARDPAAKPPETASTPVNADSAATPPENATIDAGAPAPPKVAEITLIDAGQEPRVALRLKPEVDQITVFELRTESAVSTSINGQTVAQAVIPIVVQKITYRTISVSEDRFTVSWQASLSAETGPKVDPGSLEKMKAQLASAKDIRGKSVFSLRGVMLENEMQNEDPQLSQALAHLWFPYPKEPIGVGASWKRDVPRKVNGFDAVESVVYSLEKIESDQLTISADANTTAQPGPFNHPDLPPGAQINLKSMNGSSSKRSEISAPSNNLQSSQQDSQITTVLQMQDQGQSQEIVTETTLKVSGRRSDG